MILNRILKEKQDAMIAIIRPKESIMAIPLLDSGDLRMYLFQFGQYLF